MKKGKKDKGQKEPLKLDLGLASIIDGKTVASAPSPTAEPSSIKRVPPPGRSDGTKVQTPNVQSSLTQASLTQPVQSKPAAGQAKNLFGDLDLGPLKEEAKKEEKKQESTKVTPGLFDGLALDLRVARAEESVAPASTPRIESKGAASLSPKLDGPKVEGPYERLYREERWNELGHYAESHLTHHGVEDPEARLWWVRAQLKLGGIPASILSASLESTTVTISEKPQSSTSLYALAGCVLLEMSNVLKDKNEGDLARVFLERAENLKKGVVSPTSTVHAHVNSTTGTSTAKIVAPRKTPPDVGVGTLAEKVKQVRDQRAATVPQAAKPARTDVSKASFFAERRSVQIGGAALGGVLVSAFLLFPALAGWNAASKEGTVHAYTFDLEGKPALLLPQIDRVNGLSHLAALYYDFDKRGPAHPAPVAPVQQMSANGPVDLAPSAPSAVASGADPALNSAPNNGVAAVKAPEPRERRGKKEVVNTSGPIESNDIRAYESQQKNDDEPYTIDFPPYRNAENRPDRGRDGNGNSFGRRGNGEGGMERFSAPRTYTITKRTTVMSGPSVKAFQVEELDTGDEIVVEAQIGPWLQLRSKRNQVGYILADDAENGSLR